MSIKICGKCTNCVWILSIIERSAGHIMWCNNQDSYLYNLSVDIDSIACNCFKSKEPR